MLENHVYEHDSWFVTDSGLSISTKQLHSLSGQSQIIIIRSHNNNFYNDNLKVCPYCRDQLYTEHIHEDVRTIKTFSE